jgi:diacylglycerol O-acyltransferase
MKRKTITHPDYAWLRMNAPNNLMVITGVMIFDAPLDYPRFKATIEQRLLVFKRFRQRLVTSKTPFTRPYWEDDPEFDLDRHLQRIQLPIPDGQATGDQRALLDTVGAYMSVELDYDHPLWQFYLIESYAEGSAFIARLHHSIADGISLMQVLLYLTDATRDAPLAGKPLVPTQSDEAPAQTLKSAALNSARWSAKTFWQEGGKMIRHPSRAVHLARQAVDFSASVASLVFRRPDPKTLFKGPLGLEKRAVLSEPIPLQDVKDIAKTFNGKVNDVLLTAAAGALGRYLEGRGQAPKDLSIRSFVPINLRPIQLDEELGNKFGMVFLSLPLGITDPVERLGRVKQNMDAIKSSYDPVSTYAVIHLLGATPAWVEGIAVGLFDSKGSLIITNVPGPQHQLYLAGMPIKLAMAWVPQSGRIAVGVSIFSYNGEVWVGIATDQSLVPDPERLLELFQAEYDELLRRARAIQAERQKVVQPMLEMLGEDIQALDDLLAKGKDGH